ncbi:MAG: 16S rRNA (cytidine(1402)-2'-O)-methyltransferase [Halobacteriovoraceae bacterium]|nr:16S rRNA (cytidine(1402)-2'-O)-methyltransferase [Halobacteriovoraceae bacterium]|tara:strand:- start:3887 stop:4720 length:834 start_codon:yes stop_codon:yes gene_type:complete
MEQGTLALVTTPIGNLGDITPRAIEALNRANIIYCEDTRHFRKLAQAVGVSLSGKGVFSFHDHSSAESLTKILETLKENICAFVSDAGSPMISDPAFPLVKLCIENNISIYSAGGVSSVVMALELSGLPATPFHFHGFLPRDKSKKLTQFTSFGQQYGTHIFFEGVSRVRATLEELTEMYPDYDFVVARELTKEFESFYRFKGSDASQMLDEIVYKGEFVVLMHNESKASSNTTSSQVAALTQQILEKGPKPKLLSKLISEISGVPAKDIYNKFNKS